MNKPKIVVLTGAGISAESGLKTFRDNDGLWENHRVEDVATPEAFQRNPELVYRFYNLRREQLQSPQVKPNAAHHALAKLEAEFDDKLMLVTQNVDNLHERAGSQHVVHMHGDLLSSRCCHSGNVMQTTEAYDSKSFCTCCETPSAIRPNIVWFGEMPMHMESIHNALLGADWFIAIGTSGNVYPAAGFVEVAKYAGAKTVELNLEPSNNAVLFDQQISGEASRVVPEFLEKTFLKSNY